MLRNETYVSLSFFFFSVETHRFPRISFDTVDLNFFSTHFCWRFDPSYTRICFNSYPSSCVILRYCKQPIFTKRTSKQVKYHRYRESVKFGFTWLLPTGIHRSQRALVCRASRLILVYSRQNELTREGTRSIKFLSRV